MDNLAKHDVLITKAVPEDLSPEKIFSFGSFLDLPLTEVERDLRTIHILKRIDEIIGTQDRQEMIESVKDWRDQYYGILDETSFPWASAFNLDMKMTPKIQDAVVAQTQEAFDDSDPHWAVGPVHNKEVMAVRDKQEKILDYYDDTEMRNNEDLEAIRHDAYLFGNGYEMLVFDRNFIRVRDNKTYTSLEQFAKDFPNDYQKNPKFIESLARGESINLNLEFNQEWRRSPRRKHVKYEDAIVPLEAKGVEGMNKTDTKGIRKWMKWYEIKELEDDGDAFPRVSARLKYKEGLDSNDQVQPDPDYLIKEYECYEVQHFMNINIDGKKERVLTFWLIEKTHQLPIRAIRYPYNHMRSCLISHSIKYTNEGHYQDGMGRMLHDIHMASNAALNHILNAAVLANSMTLKVRENTGAARQLFEHQAYPGSVLELQNMDDVQQLQFGTPNLASLVVIMKEIERYGQDVSGIVNYQLGVESPDDPSAPASKTIALMRKAEIKLRRYIKNLKRSEDEVGYQALRLIYQFIPIEKLSEILGKDASDTKDFLQPAIRVVTNASGFAIEKMFEKRDDMSMGMAVMKEPEVFNDPERRVRVWHTIAKSAGSNWDKKIIGIVPTPEEMKAKKEQQRKALEDRKVKAIKDTAQQVLQGGGSPEEAREAGLKAGEAFTTMYQREQAQAQAGQDGRKK